MDLLHTDLDDSALARSFASAKPFRHLVIDDFLAPAFCRELASAFPGFSSGETVNEFGEEAGKAVCRNVRELGESFRHFDELLRSRSFLDRLSRITGVPELLYDPEYVGGGTHENLHGQDLDPHVDFNYHPTTGQHRRLNLILFLNEEWAAAWGGALDFHRDPWNPEDDQVRSVCPVFNRCVVFETTENSWHGFQRIELPPEKRHLSRRSVAVYFYTNERPVEEAALEHSTVYVPRGLPNHLQAGQTMAKRDLDSLRGLLSRTSKQIRFLYERLQELQGAIEERGEHNRALVQEHSRVIAQHEEHVRLLAEEHEKVLDEHQQHHQRVVAEREEHIRVLTDEHERVIADHERLLADHDRVITEYEQQVRSLTEEHEKHVRSLAESHQDVLNERDRHNRLLAEEIQDHKKVIKGIESSLAFRLGRLLTWPLRAH